MEGRPWSAQDAERLWQAVLADRQSNMHDGSTGTDGKMDNDGSKRGSKHKEQPASSRCEDGSEGQPGKMPKCEDGSEGQEGKRDKDNDGNNDDLIFCLQPAFSKSKSQATAPDGIWRVPFDGM